MRAHVKQRQRNRRLTILAAVAIVGISLAAGVYVALNLTTSGLDKQIGKPVTLSDMTTLNQLAHAAYGPSDVTMLATLKNATGSLYFSNGKPIVVYIGGEFCPYCAIERWSMILAFSRFGNFSNLHYTTSANDEGDYATFTFVGSTYNSSYVVLRPYEQVGRTQDTPLQTVPSNYTVEFNKAYPFLNFGNKYLAPYSLDANPGLLAGKNWTQIMTSISKGDALGSQIKMGANAITALVCKITGNDPTSVCDQNSIRTLTDTLVSYTPSSASSGSELLLSDASFALSPSTLFSRRTYSGWD
ncbi:MAG: DUF929 family protein [Nitrososphaerales archaeon]